MSIASDSRPQPWNSQLISVQAYQSGQAHAPTASPGRALLKMSSNENLAGPAPAVRERLISCLSNLCLYPQGSGQALKERLAQRHGLDSARITLGNGSNEVLDFLGRCFLAPGKQSVCARHAFSVYGLVTQICGARLEVAEANPPDHRMPYGHNLDAMLEKINAQTAIVFIANPNNPTGTCLSEVELRGFLDRVPSSLPVVVDQAYIEYAGEDCAHADLWLDDYPNLVVTRTFSKVFALAGLRIGCLLYTSDAADE